MAHKNPPPAYSQLRGILCRWWSAKAETERLVDDYVALRAIALRAIVVHDVLVIKMWSKKRPKL